MNGLNYFLIGIKGSGMSALAKLLYDKGHHIAGSDVDTTFFTEERLSFCKIYPLGTILEDYVYIVGSVFVGGSDHLEVIKRGYPVYRYNEFLNTLDGIGIAVSGTHGKTTITSLIAHLFKDERIDYLMKTSAARSFRWSAAWQAKRAEIKKRDRGLCRGCLKNGVKRRGGASTPHHTY